MATRQYDLTGFTRIDIGSAFQAEIVRADAFSVQVEASEDQLDHLKVEAQGDKLTIRQEWRIFGWRPSRNRPSVRITLPKLAELRLSGASRGRATGFDSGDDFRLDVSGASRLDADIKAGDSRLDLSGASRLEGHFKTAGFRLDASGASRFEGDLEAGKARMELSGASKIELSGSADSLDIEANGASRAKLDDLAAGDVSVSLSGASRITATVSGKLSAHLSGASKLNWRGEATMGEVSVGGSSTLKKS
jgi:hypothetical protein